MATVTPSNIRLRMDAILALAARDDRFRKRLIKAPRKVLQNFGFSAAMAKNISIKWGIGPDADCGDTCRLTSPCGWTVCGKTTNSCINTPPGTDVINPNPIGRQISAKG
jgi:hypothetical protein